MKRILVTGSREWPRTPEGWDAIYRAIREQVDLGMYPSVVVHGAAEGADRGAGRAAAWVGIPEERHPAKDFPSPRARNRHMVNLGADVCLSFALKWASGTGMCARMARKAGIPVIDYGVDTSMEARP